MATVRQFEDLEVWQSARVLAREICAATSKGAFAKDFGLRDQVQRAAVSIASNIAEGFERSGNKEFASFLWIAKGSAAEVSSQLYNAKDIGYISDAQFETLNESSKTIRAKIYRLIQTLKSSPVSGIRYRDPVAHLKP